MRQAAPADDGPRSAVVRPLARAAGRTCARPGCPSPAQATLTFVYDAREVVVDSLTGEPSPAAYDLCTAHADRTTPPHRWQLVDRRPADEVETPRRSLGGEQTVAVLAAALHGDDAPRAVPDVVEEAPAAAPEEPAAAPEVAEPATGPAPADPDRAEAVAQAWSELVELARDVESDARAVLRGAASGLRGADGPGGAGHHQLSLEDPPEGRARSW